MSFACGDFALAGEVDARNDSNSEISKYVRNSRLAVVPTVRNGRFLLMEYVTPYSCGVAGVVGLSYSCSACEGFTAHCGVVSEAETALALMVAAMRR